jgi:urocanate hydratase
VPAYIRPLFCEGKGPFRWVALSGDPQDIYTTDEAMLELFPEDEHLARWIRMAQKQIAFQGLPARICWLGYGERAKAGLKFNELVASGKVRPPSSSGAIISTAARWPAPTVKPKACSTAPTPSPIGHCSTHGQRVNGATWVSIHHGGGVGIGYSIHAGQVIVADGSEAAARRLERVLTSDPGMGVVRHVDAGYPEAIRFAKAHHVKVPMMA